MELQLFGLNLSRVKLPTLRPNVSSRPQVKRFGIVMGTVSVLLLIGGVGPFLWQRIAIAREVAAQEQNLSPEYRKGEEALVKDLDVEKKRVTRLSIEWAELNTKLQCFKRTYVYLTRDPRRVDYQGERYKIFRLLEQKLSRKLPESFKDGLPPGVTSTDDTARKVVHLRSAGALMNEALDWGMKSLDSVRFLDPEQFRMPNTSGGLEVFGVELPIEIVATGDTQSIGRWLLAAAHSRDVIDPKNGEIYYFMVRNIRLEKSAPHDPSSVRATVVFSAILIVKDPDQFSIPKEIKAVPFDDA